MAVDRGEERGSKFRKRTNVAFTRTAVGWHSALSSLRAKARWQRPWLDGARGPQVTL